MKKFMIALAGVVALAAPAFAYDYDKVREEENELRDSKRAVQKDTEVIEKYENTMEQNRAEKARAKAEGDYGRQAKESVAIGANKAAIKTREAKRRIDQELLEKDRRDLREARGETSDREMSPSAGIAYRDGEARMTYYQRFPTRYPQANMNKPGYDYVAENNTDYTRTDRGY